MIGKRDLRSLGSFSPDKAYYSVMALGASVELLVWATDVQGGTIVLYFILAAKNDQNSCLFFVGI